MKHLFAAIKHSFREKAVLLHGISDFPKCLNQQLHIVPSVQLLFQALQLRRRATTRRLL